jgi:SAM-dependent methyltransferase
VDYYDEHAAEFIANTQSVDLSELYGPFLSLIPGGGRILDAGCGSGRDSLAFLKLGYDVTWIDASAKMVEATAALTGRLQRIGFEVTITPGQRSMPSPQGPPLPGQTCSKCNAWGIACIHVRPRQTKPRNKLTR